MEGCFRWLRCWRNSGSSSWSKRPSRHPMHLHRHQLELVDFNGKPTSGLIRDTVVVPFYGRAAVEFTANREDALDLTQDAFLKAYQNLRKLDDPGRFAPWLYRIAH